MATDLDTQAQARAHVTATELADAPPPRTEDYQANPFLRLRERARGVRANRWDVAAFVLLIGLFAMIGLGAHQVGVPLTILRSHGISLDPLWLPEYAMRTSLRMLAAMLASLVFSIGYAYLAARSRRAERVLVPLLDVLQSVPILGFLSFTVTFFLGLFPGQVIGAELASIFAIFTSQAWNMTLSVYQSLRTVPADLVEASRSLRLSPWQRFTKLELPFALPGLVWNMMMSMSGGWFFVVAAEAISVGAHTVELPGVGSYVALAIEKRDLGAIGWAILTMLGVILLYDQLLFRPLIAWSERFRSDDVPTEIESESWVLRMLQRSRLIEALSDAVTDVFGRVSRLGRRVGELPRSSARRRAVERLPNWWIDVVWYGAIGIACAYAAWSAIQLMAGEIGPAEVLHAVLLGGATLLRVLILVALTSLIWVPIGVYIGLRPRLASFAQPAAQFLAAFPANLFFPVAVAVIVALRLDPNIWLSPLMVLGTQWYILFNVIAGTRTFPRDLLDAAKNVRLRGWLWWKRVMLPGILPYYVTGAMTAAGGCWNASIVSEFVDWGHTHLQAAGLGAYIQQATLDGDYPRIVLGVAVMALFVVGLNRTLWRPLYRRAERHSGNV